MMMPLNNRLTRRGYRWFATTAPAIAFGAAALCLLLACRADAVGSGETPSGTLLAVNQGDSTLSIIDPRTAKQVGAVPEGGVTGHEVAASLDGKVAYVAVYGNSGVGRAGTDGRDLVAIDIKSQRVVGHVDFGHGVRPHCMVMNPKDGMLYVTTELDRTVTIIDPKSLKIVGSIPTGQEQSHMLAISHDGLFGYTANVGPGTVSVVDMQTRKLVTVVPVSPQTQRISISNDDAMVFTADQTKPRLAVIDTATRQVKTWIPLPAVGYGTTPTRDGRWLLVAIPSTSQVAVVDLKTLQVVRTVDVPKMPQEILVTPDGGMAYVSCTMAGTVAAIRIADWSVVHAIAAGTRVDGLGWAAAGR